jgi:Protein of unknown function (DUF2568)
VTALAVVAFLTELAALVILGMWGARTGQGGWSWLLALAAPVAFAAIWGAFLSPRAVWPLPFALSLGLKTTVFALATWAAWTIWGGGPTALFGLAVALGLLAELSRP